MPLIQTGESQAWLRYCLEPALIPGYQLILRIARCNGSLLSAYQQTKRLGLFGIELLEQAALAQIE
jgi:hypothetical protein